MEVESTNYADQPDNSDYEDGYISEEDLNNREDEAEEVPDPEATNKVKEVTAIKPKRVIKNPQPKLDATRLMGPRGLGILQSTCRSMKFKGKGYEKEDLNMLMKTLEHWSHRLFPKMTFDDSLKQIEKLGTKKPVQNMVKKIRLDMFQSDELTPAPSDAIEEGQTNNADEIDIFDGLLNSLPSQRPQTQIHDFDPLPVSTQPPVVNVLSEEQRERMERNRLAALERRRAKMSSKAAETGSEAPGDGAFAAASNQPSSMDTDLASVRSQPNVTTVDQTNSFSTLDEDAVPSPGVNLNTLTLSPSIERLRETSPQRENNSQASSMAFDSHFIPSPSRISQTDNDSSSANAPFMTNPSQTSSLPDRLRGELETTNPLGDLHLFPRGPVNNDEPTAFGGRPSDGVGVEEEAKTGVKRDEIKHGNPGLPPTGAKGTTEASSSHMDSDRAAVEDDHLFTEDDVLDLVNEDLGAE